MCTYLGPQFNNERILGSYTFNTFNNNAVFFSIMMTRNV